MWGEAMSENNGWICPKCGKVYAPFIAACLECNEKANLVARKCQLHNGLLDIAKARAKTLRKSEYVLDPQYRWENEENMWK